jgi:hypothetical protein
MVRGEYHRVLTTPQLLPTGLCLNPAGIVAGTYRRKQNRPWPTVYCLLMAFHPTREARVDEKNLVDLVCSVGAAV